MVGLSHPESYSTLRLILGDQLNARHSWFREKRDDTVYVIAELKQECLYVRHHGQKIAAFFQAMALFAEALDNAGHQVCYLTLDETTSFADLDTLLQALLQQFQCQHFEYQQPDEMRLSAQLKQFCAHININSQCFDTEHFIVPHAALAQYVQADKAHTMESFYRKLRKQTGYLMAGNQPLGGKWNFDADNRAALKAEDLAHIPEPLCFANDIVAIRARLERHSIAFIGTLTESLLWPTSRRQARELLAYFCQYLLPNFGRFQDAMTANHQHKWSLYHSRLSFAMNCKMLSPQEVIETAIAAYESKPEHISIAQIEGFVRQILGWREFIRAMYWANYERFRHSNFLNATQSLPEYFWHGNTKMRCLSEAIGQSLHYGYAHHIQRLMITGNFSLLLGVEPKQIEQWYLAIYVDAIEWVEMPNTVAMSQYSDGGLLASKPYCSSGNYINKMSDYCQSCAYQVNSRTGQASCPFNSLYWHFLHRNQAKLSSNPRLGYSYRTWSNYSESQQQAILEQAQYYIDHAAQL